MAKTNYDRVQEIMTRAHQKFWAQGPYATKQPLTDIEKLTFYVGHFNYQVRNGGISQWIFNSYAKDEAAELLAVMKRLLGEDCYGLPGGVLGCIKSVCSQFVQHPEWHDILQGIGGHNEDEEGDLDIELDKLDQECYAFPEDDVWAAMLWAIGWASG